jgi:hypothetical protein
MATSTLIQRLDVTALVPSSTVPGGYDVVGTPDVSNRLQVETFIVIVAGYAEEANCALAAVPLLMPLVLLSL